MTEPQDLMLILGADARAEDVLGQHRVTQTISPRVVIIDAGGRATKAELHNKEGIQAVLEPGETLSDELRGTLTSNEALFVDAYGRRARQKVRPGEGLSWDAEGFLPPDLPKST